MAYSDIEQRIMDRLNADPVMRELFGGVGREPRYRYWQSPDGRMFIWTTERYPDGKYASAVYAPFGKGARSGRRNVTRWKLTREVRHTTRKAAKARAYRLYCQAKES